MSKAENSLPPSSPADNPNKIDNFDPSSEFLRITDWNEVQGTVGHKLPFVKVQSDLYRSHEFLRLPLTARSTYYPLLQYAASNRNHIPNDPDLLGAILHLGHPADLGTLLKNGFLESWSAVKHQEMVDAYEAKKEYDRDRKNKSNANKNKKRKRPTSSKLIQNKVVTPPTESSQCEPVVNPTGSQPDHNRITVGSHQIPSRDLETKRLKTKQTPPKPPPPENLAEEGENKKNEPTQETTEKPEKGFEDWDWEMMGKFIKLRKEKVPGSSQRGLRRWQMARGFNEMRIKHGISKENINLVVEFALSDDGWRGPCTGPKYLIKKWAVLLDRANGITFRKANEFKPDYFPNIPELTEEEKIEQQKKWDEEEKQRLAEREKREDEQKIIEMKNAKAAKDAAKKAEKDRKPNALKEIKASVIELKKHEMEINKAWWLNTLHRAVKNFIVEFGHHPLSGSDLKWFEEMEVKFELEVAV